MSYDKIGYLAVFGEGYVSKLYITSVWMISGQTDFLTKSNQRPDETAEARNLEFCTKVSLGVF